MSEIKSVALRHGGVGVPRGFRAEAAALETLAAAKALFTGQLGRASTHAGDAVMLRPRPVRFVMHAFSQVIPGRAPIPRLRLVANLARSVGSRTTYPAQMPAVAVRQWVAVGR